MELQEIFPLIVPAMIVQISIQIYYIVHVRKNPKLTDRQRFWFTLGIAGLNLPIAALYLFQTREKTMERSVEGSRENVDGAIQQAIFVLLVVAYEIYAIQLILGNRSAGGDMTIVWLLGACFVLSVLDELYVFHRFSFLRHPFALAEIGLAYAVYWVDATGDATFFVVIVAVLVLNRFAVDLAKKYILLAVAGFMFLHTAKVIGEIPTADMDALIGEFYLRTVGIVLILGAFFMLKKQIVTSKHLGIALETVQQQSKRLEEMSIIAERNRMAKEIHDTVGHRLTGALLNIEAAKRLTQSQAEQDKLDRAAGQVKDALGDIRHSVRMIEYFEEDDFRERLYEIARSNQKELGLDMTIEAAIVSTLLPIQQHMITRALMECATNSIKHGKAKKADVLIQEFGGAVHFSYSDDGFGCENPTYGFGLRAMESQVLSLGGAMDVQSAAGEGFSVHFQLPVGKMEGGSRND
ncbi:MAG TPA: hypothetical protein DHN33_01255 [Eubacteriaceae bacterium]|nr:hypothetical protein [Eubacteriaceae bacterium]